MRIKRMAVLQHSGREIWRKLLKYVELEGRFQGFVTNFESNTSIV